jgi:hypothetical protein
MKLFFYFFQMKYLISSLLIILLSSCERYALPISDLTLSGKYKLTLLDVTSVDQNVSKDSLYRAGSVYLNSNLPKPFDSIVLNRFYIHLDYSTIRMNLLGVGTTGNDIWEYGSSPNFIFYRVLNNTTYNHGYLQFDYENQTGSKTLTFHIEEDGIETLQLQSTGSWARGKFGEKQVLTFVWTRVGP